MATPPTFVGEAELAWNSVTSPKVSPSITTQVGDVLVVGAIGESQQNPIATPTNSGTAETWTLQKSLVPGSSCTCYIWTTVCTAAQTMTVTVTRAGGGGFYGANVLQFRGSDGVGASNTANAAGAPSVSVTTLQANSALVVFSGDFNAGDGTTRTWATVNSIVGAEQSYFRDSARYTIYAAYWSDAGSVGSKSPGITAPAGQQYSTIVVEIKGAAGAPYPFGLLTPTPNYR